MGAIADSARGGYAAFNRRDREAVLAMITDDFSWHEAPEVPGPQTAGSREEFARYLESFDALWDELRFDVRELREGDDRIYARVLLRGRGRASGDELELEIHHVWTLRGDSFAEMRAYLDRAQALEAAGLPVE